MQWGGYYFFSKSIKMKKSEKLKIFFAVMALMLFAVSILGTLCYRIGLLNEASNDTYLKSDVFKSKAETRASIENVIKDLGTDKESTIKSYDAQIKTLRDELNTVWIPKKKYRTKRGQINDKINLLLEKKAKCISESNKAIISQSSQLKAIKTTKKDVELLETKGELSFANTISGWFEWDALLINLFIQSLISLVFEITAIGLHLAAEIERRNAPEQKVVRSSTTKTKNDNSVSEKDKKKVIDELNNFKSENGTIKIGYKKIAKNLNLKENTVREIYKQLKDNNKMKVVDGKTKLL
jgi:hypothetical protein